MGDLRKSFQSRLTYNKNEKVIESQPVGKNGVIIQQYAGKDDFLRFPPGYFIWQSLFKV